MREGSGETIQEPERDVPVYGHCDVLVVGGGPVQGSNSNLPVQVVGNDSGN